MRRDSAKKSSRLNRRKNFSLSSKQNKLRLRKKVNKREKRYSDLTL